MKHLDLFNPFRVLNRKLMPQCVLDANGGKGWYPFISTFTTWSIIFVFLWRIIDLIISFRNPDLTDFRYTEFFINYEGGFVRRGLLGECLLQLSKFTGVSPDIFISIGCLAVFLIVVAFFLREFKANGYCWWLLFSPFLFGYMNQVVRKDYLLYGLLILILLLIRPSRISLKRVIVASILLLLSLFIHEAFIFWGVPICLVLLFSQKKFRWCSLALGTVAVAVFLLLCYFKGDSATVKAIWDSWDGTLRIATDFSGNNSVNSIGWSSEYAFLFHLKTNFLDNMYYPLGIVIRCCFVFLAYYFIMNFLAVFSPDKFSNEKRIALGSVWLLTVICMIPMLTILCCDYARMYQFITVTAISTILIVPSYSVIKYLPSWYVGFINRIDTVMRKFCMPSRGLMLVMLLTLAATPMGIDMNKAFQNSILGGLLSSTKGVIELAIMVLR